MISTSWNRNKKWVHLNTNAQESSWLGSVTLHSCVQVARCTSQLYSKIGSFVSFWATLALLLPRLSGDASNLRYSFQPPEKHFWLRGHEFSHYSCLTITILFGVPKWYILCTEIIFEMAAWIKYYFIYSFGWSIVILNWGKGNHIKLLKVGATVK